MRQMDTNIMNSKNNTYNKEENNMSAITNNVVGLHMGNVWEDIQTHLKGFESKHTSENYERGLRKFFQWFKGKDLELLTREDLYIRNADVLKYRNFLKEILDEEGERQYTNTSINNVIAAIQSLYVFLEKNDYDVKSVTTRANPLADDSVRCGALYTHEAEKMADIIIDTVKGIEKSALIRMAYITSFRKGSLLRLEWDDIVEHPSNKYYEVTVMGKGGKKHTVPISEDLYQYVLKIKDQRYYERYNDNKIFHLSTGAIQDMMTYLKDKMSISEQRNVVFHSFRNVASMYGTLEEAKEHYNHSSFNVTEKYRHKDNDMSNSLSLRIGEKIDDEIFMELSKEEIIQLVLRQNEGVIHQMKRDAQKIVNDKNENKKESVE
jgi:site-specific recombinase XerD